MAPLSRSAGGLGLCGGDVFVSTTDPDYLELLGTIESAAERLSQNKRFDMPGFRPNEHYIRQMQRFGGLPQNLGQDEEINAYAADQAYWKTFWYRTPTRKR